ncbi:MAG: 3-deoxy-7-phosphoheptulonate synthase, partial [Bacteroidetes bacterium]|nr:3-deoxy-7-phosphoheptulonate synthase [Bacteroidota bacterium]
MSKTASQFDFNLFKQAKVFVAGPCSAETEEQVHETISELATACPQISLIRAGIWKPRTRPNSFEGIGSIALSWLKNAGKQVNLPVATEVANANHV